MTLLLALYFTYSKNL